MQLKIGAYVRVSTEEQASAIEGSLDNQQYRLKAFLDLKNTQLKKWGEIVDFYIDDGFSAKDTRRPAYQRMMKDIQSKKVDLILVTDLSRLSRNIFDFCNLMDDLEKNEAQFLSIKEQFDSTTPTGKMMIYNMINLAQFEREQVSERVSLGVHSRSMRGLLNGAKSILGFEKAENNKGSYIINEQEADNVRIIFRTFLNYGSCSKTIHEINKLEIKPKSNIAAASSNDLKWNSQGLAYMLSNRAYIGELEVNKKRKNKDQNRLKHHHQYKLVKATWPAIIDIDDFEKVQALLEQAKKNERVRLEGAEERFYLLTGSLACSECSHSLVGQVAHGRKQIHRYYGHTTKTSKFNCVVQRICSDEVEKVVLDYVWDSIEDAGYLNRIEDHLKKIQNVKSLSFARSKKADKDQLALTQTRIDNLLTMQTQITSPAVLKQLSKTFESLVMQKSELEFKLQTTHKSNEGMHLVNDTIKGIKARLNEIEKGFTKASRPMKKRLLNNLLKQLILTPEGLHIKIYMADGFEIPIKKIPSNVIEIGSKSHTEDGSGGFGSFSNLSVSGSDINRLGDSGTTRTYDPLLRREMLYPTELRNHIK